MGEVRETKKRETRQRISDVATKLFFARGFEEVTLDEIAHAAKVSKMTIVNYFTRKEELLLDREDDLKLLPFRNALRDRKKGQKPIAALRALVEEWNASAHPLLHVGAPAVGWWKVVTASPTLKARLAELADEAAQGLAIELGGPKPNAVAKLAGATIVLTVRVAREEAMGLLERGASAKKANAALLATMDHGLTMVEKLLADV